MSYRSCPSCGFLVAENDLSCPLCHGADASGRAVVATGVLDPSADATELRAAVGADGEATEPDAPASLVDALGEAPAAWLPTVDEVPAKPEPATVPMVIAVVSVLAMVLLWAFGGSSRVQADYDLADPAAVAAALPTTIPAGWVAHTDAASGWFGRFPAGPASRDDVAADGTPVHVVEAITPAATYRVAWDDLPSVPGPSDVPALLDATLAAAVPAAATLGPVDHPVADPTVASATFTTADGLSGQARVVLRGARRYRLVAFGSADELAATWPRVVDDFVAA